MGNTNIERTDKSSITGDPAIEAAAEEIIAFLGTRITGGAFITLPLKGTVASILRKHFGGERLYARFTTLGQDAGGPALSICYGRPLSTDLAELKQFCTPQDWYRTYVVREVPVGYD